MVPVVPNKSCYLWQDISTGVEVSDSDSRREKRGLIKPPDARNAAAADPYTTGTRSLPVGRKTVYVDRSVTPEYRCGVPEPYR
jgi:hypothetical protein